MGLFKEEGKSSAAEEVEGGGGCCWSSGAPAAIAKEVVHGGRRVFCEGQVSDVATWTRKGWDALELHREV
jgi:hypothetical protein